jgi:hypothetical protein
MAEMKMHTKFYSDNMKGRDHLEDLDIGRTIILEWILGKEGGKIRTGCI